MLDRKKILEAAVIISWIVIPLIIVVIIAVSMDYRWERKFFINNLFNDIFPGKTMAYKEIRYGTKDSGDGLGNYLYIWDIQVSSNDYAAFDNFYKSYGYHWGYKYSIQLCGDNIVKISSPAIEHDKLYSFTDNGYWLIPTAIIYAGLIIWLRSLACKYMNAV